MRKGSAAEWMLERAAGDVRGVAIYGDLLELAATRGRVWFWMAYVRTLVALVWRTAAGICLGLAVVAANRLVFGENWHRFVFFHFPHAWRFPHGRAGMSIYNFLYRAVASANVTGCLLTSYAAVKYGIHDKMARAALPVSVMLASAMALARVWPLAVLLLGLAIATTACALLVSEWRGAFASVAATLAAGTIVAGCLLWADRLFHDRWFSVGPEMWVIYVLDMVFVVGISARLHGRFVTGGRIAAG